MRTVIFVSAMMLSDSLKSPDLVMSNDATGFFSICLIIFIIVDVVEFIHNMRKK